MLWYCCGCGGGMWPTTSALNLSSVTHAEDQSRRHCAVWLCFIDRTVFWPYLCLNLFCLFIFRSFETQLSRVEADLLRREAPPSYGQLIAQGLIPPVEDFPVCSPNQVNVFWKHAPFLIIKDPFISVSVVAEPLPHYLPTTSTDCIICPKRAVVYLLQFVCV